MHSLFILQFSLTILVLFQLVTIFATNRRAQNEKIVVSQLCLGVMILATLFSELIFFSYTSVLTGFALFFELFLLPMFWKQLKDFED